MRTKKAFLSVCFLLLSQIFYAQDKYQFLIMEYSTMDNKITVSIDGTEFIKEKVDFDKHDKSGYNANPLLEKVKEYQSKNWEVMSFSTQIGGNAPINGSGMTSGGYNSSEVYFAYMRKKIAD
jgi:hypothetical protein